MSILPAGATLEVTAPGVVENLWLKEGPAGLPGDDGAPGAPGGSDASFAGWIDDTESLTYAAGVAAFGSLVNISNYPGVDPTGVAACGPAFQSALDAVAAFGGVAYAVGGFNFGTTTVSIEGDCWFPASATFSYSGTGAAVQLGDGGSGVLMRHKRVALGKIVNTGTKWGSGRIGVKAVNTQECDISVSEVVDFETGYYAYGLGGGNSYNDVRLAHLNNNKRNLVLGAGTGGWSNSNTYRLGSLSHNSGEGTNVANTRQILIETGTTHLVNGNLFLGGSVEGDVAEYELDCDGYENEFVAQRWENTGGGKVIWRANGDRNIIRGGYGTHLLVETFVSGATLNRIWSTGTTHLNGSSDTATFVFENRASADNATDVVMDPGAREDGSDPATDYRVHRSANYTRTKRATDAYARTVWNHDHGRFYFGNGTAEPTAYFGNLNNNDTAELNGAHLSFRPDNTYDFGYADLRPRDGFFGRDLTVGRKVITTASATGGAGLVLPHGAAPTSPVDGDVWTTTAGVYARINGATVGPFGTGGGGGTGDVVGPASSVDSRLALFDSTTGKLLKQSSLAESAVVSLTGSQALANKDLSSGTNTFPTFNQNTTGSAATLTTSRTIGILTGDVTSAGSGFNGSANNTNATTLATVNSNVGSFGSATQVPVVTVNAKGLTTAASNTTIQLASTAAVTGLDTALGLKAPLASPTFTGTVSGITKTMVGLGSVDNTADTAKPVSTAQQTALDLKAPLASPTFTGTPVIPNAIIDEEVVTASGTSGTVTLDLSTSRIFTLTPTGNVTTLTVSNWPAGRGTTVTLIVDQGATARTIALPSGGKPMGAAMPTQANNKDCIFTYFSADGGTTIYCSASQEV
jgi:hypothetical protein